MICFSLQNYLFFSKMKKPRVVERNCNRFNEKVFDEGAIYSIVASYWNFFLPLPF